MNLLHTAEDAVAPAVPQTRLVRPIAIALQVLLILAGLAGAWWVVFGRPRQAQVKAATATVQAATATAGANAAQDTVRIVTAHDHTIERINTITEGGVRAVQSAADAGTPVPAVAAALRGALCLHVDTYRADPSCAAVPGAGGSVGDAGADAGRADPR